MITITKQTKREKFSVCQSDAYPNSYSATSVCLPCYSALCKLMDYIDTIMDDNSTNLGSVIGDKIGHKCLSSITNL